MAPPLGLKSPIAVNLATILTIGGKFHRPGMRGSAWPDVCNTEPANFRSGVHVAEDSASP